MQEFWNVDWTVASINPDRLISRLTDLRAFGAHGNGVVRPSLSEVDLRSRQWLIERMEEAGLDASIDGVGNVLGRSRNPGPGLLLGSHTDTQPEGGWLDGAMGVMHALEVAAALAEDPATAHLCVDVASWCDEEGTYAGMSGSRSFVGSFDDAELESTNADGETLRAALKRADLIDKPRATLDPQRYVGYLETHIEQGPVLDDEGLRIGVVTGIVGIRALRIEFSGQQNHAGTTPMDRRRDAVTAFVRWAAALHDQMPSIAGPTSVWTIANVAVSPGAESIVPGHVVAQIQFRDPDEHTLDAMEAFMKDLCAQHDRDVAVKAELFGASAVAQPMDVDMRRALATAAEAVVPGAWKDMASAAGHDAQVIAPKLASGMLFIPSLGGISHDFAEDSSHDDIITGAEVLLQTCLNLLSNTL